MVMMGHTPIFWVCNTLLSRWRKILVEGWRNLFYGGLALCKSIVTVFGFFYNVEKSFAIGPIEIRPAVRVVSPASCRGYKYRLTLRKMQIRAPLAMAHPNYAEQRPSLKLSRRNNPSISQLGMLILALAV